METLTTHKLYPTSDKWSLGTLQDALGHFATGGQLLRSVLDAIVARCNVASIGDKAQLLVTVREFKEVLAELETECNKVLPAMEADLCKSLAAQNMFQFAMPGFTLTAKADAYLTKMPEYESPEWKRLRSWLLSHKEQGFDAYVRETISKDGVQSLCRTQLENGEPLPPEVSVYIKASVSVRRKS